MTEMERILSLPIVPPLSAEEHEELSRQVIKPLVFRKGCPSKRCDTCRDPKTGQRAPLRLLPGQAAGLRTFLKYRRAFLSIPVGGGKSALSILTASAIFARKPTAKVLLLLMPHLVRQFMTRDVPWARSHLNAWVPRWINLHGRNKQKRLTLARCQLPGVYVLPYSLFSMEEAMTILNEIKGEFVISDEAHIFAGQDHSGRQKVFWRWINSNDVPGLAMSGSFNNNTPKNFARVARWTLDDLCPLPRDASHLQTWCYLLEAKAEKPTDDEAREIRPLVRWAAKHFPSRMRDLSQTTRTIRRAFRLRLRSAPGVVVTNHSKLPVDLRICNVDPGESSDTLAALIEQVEQSSAAPDGAVLTYAIERHRVFRQLSNGFWLKHRWIESHPKIAEAKAYWEAGEDYRELLKLFMKTAQSRNLGFFIPSAVGHYHKTKGQIPGCPNLYKLWKVFRRKGKKIEPDEFRAARTTEIVPVDDFKVQAIVKWAKERTGGIVWIYHEAFGDWVFDALVEAGVRSLRKRQGDRWVKDDGSEKLIVVASIKAFGVGLNLQHHHDQVIAEWQRSQGTMEQLLGRTHRHGQRSPIVQVTTFHHFDFEHQTVAATLLDTVYDKQLFGTSKRLLLADWRPLPEEYPADFLRERGFRLAEDGAPDEDGHGSDEP